MRRLWFMIMLVGWLALGSTAFAEWTQSYFIDSFGDVTDESYIKFKTKGTFSNSAVADHICGAEIILNEDNEFGIFLHENNTKPSVSFDKGRFLMKNSKGQIFKETKIKKWNQGGGISLGANKPLISFLKESVGIVKVAIYDSYSSQYHFKIDMSNFNEMLKKLNRTPAVIEKVNPIVEKRDTLKKLE